MNDYDYYVTARMLHVIGVVLWIGGVGFVATVLIPSLNKMSDMDNKTEVFSLLEGRFAKQAKTITLLTGISGFYMLDYMNAWHRFLEVDYWWMHLMVAIWFIYSAILFLFEPLFLYRWFAKEATQNSAGTLLLMRRLHKLLLVFSLLAVVGAVSGSHGYVFFSVKG